ncbi:hypothetical protein PRIPAC_94488 [Pristionchus pacificus]|uniref:Uncharacterized protein n=1 Tax=Pristionchus pacificus TaxID=54126 RepID=A0A2A6BBU1_PRIPA|nr:hypothetical protein PRIPAC_94488 [Pristionchus pacificus]|eukprot:PDM63337.1 hypothetical protein PRIPAC_50552 [Pristionchus pacificus]
MRSLIVILATLSLLTSTFAQLKCHNQTILFGANLTSYHTEKCGDETEYCMWFKGNDSEGNFLRFRGCGFANDTTPCTEKGRVNVTQSFSYNSSTVVFNGIRICCQDDMCNPAATATALLSLAGIAAMMAMFV